MGDLSALVWESECVQSVNACIPEWSVRASAHWKAIQSAALLVRVKVQQLAHHSGPWADVCIQAQSVHESVWPMAHRSVMAMVIVCPV